MPTIHLFREGSGPFGTFGKLHVEDWECRILERPWLGNRPFESCIPNGIYRMELRESPVVTRTSKGEFTHGWELCNVPGRTFIMIHPGNIAEHTEGCLLPGRNAAVIASRMKPGVTHSLTTFRTLMQKLSTQSFWDMNIMWESYQYP